MTLTNNTEQNTTYTVATARQILNTFTFTDPGIKKELYALADQQIDLTYLTHSQYDKSTGKHVEAVHCAMYSNPAQQAPWLAMSDDYSQAPNRTSGKLREGVAELTETVQVTRSGWKAPTALVLDQTIIESPRSLKSPNTSSPADINDEHTPEYVLRNDTHVWADASLEGGVSTRGKVGIGYATVLNTFLHGGSIFVGDDSYLEKCRLEGNISVRFAMLRNVSLEGDISISGVMSALPGTSTGDASKVGIDDGSYTSDFINHPEVETFLQSNMIQHLLEVSQDTSKWLSGSWEFCLDANRHVSPCRCALYFPLYLMGTPAAVQYMATSGSRVAKLSAGHPYNFLTISQLEIALQSELHKTWEEHLYTHDIPSSREEWVDKIQRLTNSKPDHA